MNENDSERMEALLRRDGFSKSASAKKAEVLVVNTCSIREKSYQKALSEVGRLYKNHEGGERPIVAVTGCVASHESETILKKFPFVDLVLGPDHETSLPELIREVKEKKTRKALVDFQDISDYEFPSPLLWETTEKEPQKKVKAYVTIMKGCDNTCSFCIVPFVRGEEVSRQSEDIIEEIRVLEKQGVREIMLLGQNVNSYGKGFVDKTPPQARFAKLLSLIEQETSVARVRYTSPHPKDLSDELIEQHRDNQKLCPHIHLPVQSGSSRILKKMRRAYTREVYLRKVESLRKAVPDISITTDIIVGFPGETSGAEWKIPQSFFLF